MKKVGALLNSWACLWASCTLMDVWQQPHNWPSQSWRISCAAVVVLILAKPSPLTLVAGMAIRNGARFVRMPYMWDSDIWALVFDAMFVANLCMACLHRARSDVAVIRTRPTVKAVLALFYFAAGFWKINTSFLSPRTSCGSIFTASLLAQLWPLAWGEPPDSLARLSVGIGPWLTIGGECAAGVFLAMPGKLCRLSGLVFVLLLHAGISFTAFPNGIANFSYTAATRYFFLLPDATSKALVELASIPRSPWELSTKAAYAVALAAAWHFGQVAGVQHMGAVYFSALAALYVRAAWLDATGQVLAPEPRAIGVAGRLTIATCSFWAFGAQMLGLADLGAPASPFSSIRVHGGSNHLLLPTGLLQIWANTQPARQSSFAGGVVRIEHTTSVWLNSLYPGEVTADLRPDIISVLRRGGHLGRQFNPTPRRVLPEARPFMPRWKPGDGPFLRYTLPALELRRLVHEARESGEAFTLEYVRLPGVIGDERWRASAEGPRIKLSVSSNGSQQCSADGFPCAKDELALLPEIEFWPWKTRVFFPLPIVSDAGGELPCMD